MKGKRLLLAGMVLGLGLSAALPAAAQPVSEGINAWINHSYYFTFDGTRTELPEGYHVLVYEGRSYVPARFVAEQLGASVEWHSDTKEIEIRRPEMTEPEITEPEDSAVEETTPEAILYQPLPQKIRTEDYTAEVFLHISDDDGQRLYLSLENTSDTLRLRLDQSKVVFTAGESTWEMKPEMAVDFDQRWYHYILPEETTEGYLRLPEKMDSRLTQWSVILPVVLTDNRGNEQTETLTFSIDVSE